MKAQLKLLAAATTICAAPAMAHVGPAAVGSHLVEHLLIALAIGLPVGYGLLRLLKRPASPRR